MRRSRLLLPALGLTLLAACQGRSPDAADTSSATGAAATQPPAANGPLQWSEAVTWQGDLNACRQGGNAATRECLRDAMRAGGASADAIAAAEQLSSGGELAFVKAWHEYEGVGVATVAYPFRANTNEGTRLVDAAGERIDVDALPTSDDGSDNPALQAALQAHPGAMPFAPAQSAGASPLEGGGVRLLYTTPLRNCHACPDVGQLQVAYDFDAQRKFVGQQVVPKAE